VETYYDPQDLAKFDEIGKNAPELAKKFFDYYGAVFAEGALTQREKALIALAVAHAGQCPYCIDAYTVACLENQTSIIIGGARSLVPGGANRLAAAG